MQLILGKTGFISKYFQAYFSSKGIPFLTISRSEVDYSDKKVLKAFIQENGVDFLINAAGFTGKPNVDACEAQKAECLAGNAVLPGIIREVCEEVGLPWGHVSSGCIYNGYKADGSGFSEMDEPNFSFRRGPCSFYSGTKALGEELLEGAKNCYIWRLRIPFNSERSPRNYLSKIINYKRLLDKRNSISHLGEFVASAWACRRQNVPFGIYNLTNPGSVTTREITEMMLKEGARREAEGVENPFPKCFNFFDSEEEFLEKAAKTPRSNCVLDTSKLEALNLPMRPVHEVLEEAIKAY